MTVLVEKTEVVTLVDYNNKVKELENIIIELKAKVAKIPEETITSCSTLTRPNENLKIGQQYFDTTLSVPVYWNGTKWHNPFANITTVEVENH